MRIASAAYALIAWQKQKYIIQFHQGSILAT